MLVAMVHKLWRQENGTSVIELALTLPTLILLMTGCADAAWGVGTKIALQQAAARTIEKATAGGMNSVAVPLLQAEGAAAAGVPLSNVAVDTWLECDGSRQADFNGACTNNQEVGRYVSVAIASSYRPMFSIFAWGSAPDGAIPLSAKSSVRVQ